jgi:hypothetical protein
MGDGEGCGSSVIALAYQVWGPGFNPPIMQKQKQQNDREMEWTHS